MKHVLFILLILISLILFSSSNLTATHAVGADLTYTHVGGNNYKVTLSFYRDCDGIAAPINPNISVSSISCGHQFTNTLTLVSTTEVSMLCTSLIPNSTCNGGTIQGTEEYIYEGLITLAGNCPDWKISYTLCCRNGSITNIPNAAAYSMYIETEIDNLTAPDNNSPYFTNLPLFYGCNGQLSIYTPGAIDLDGDSLVYSLINPMDDEVNPVPYISPFSSSYPLSTNPPNNFSFDPLSGQMLFTPDGIQVTIIAVLVEEYRNGIKIGSIMRDMQLIILANCSNNMPSILPPNNSNISGGTLNGNVITTCGGQTLTFPILGSDVDVNDTLIVSSNISSLPGASLTVTGVNPIIVNFSWPTIGATAGDFPLNIVISDNGCPVRFDQSISLMISVLGINATAAPATFCKGTQAYIQLNSTLTGLNSGGTYAWSPPTGLSSSTIPNPIAFVHTPTVYTVTYTDGPCTTMDTVYIGYSTDMMITPASDTICQGTSVQLDANYVDNNPTIYSCDIYNGGCPGAASTFTVGTDITSTGPNGEGTPFLGYFHDGRMQIIYTAAELNALGLTEGLITELAFNVAAKGSSIPYNNFTIKLGCTQDAFNPSIPVFLGNVLTVMTATVTTTLGWNNFVFSNAYYWNGTDDLLIEICFDNIAYTQYDEVFYSQTAGTSLVYNRVDNSSGCGLSASIASNRRPNIRLKSCGYSPIPTIFSWSPSIGLDDPTIPNPTATPSTTTTYTLTINGGGCILTDSVTITVFSGVQFTLSSVDPGCGMSNGSIMVNTTSGIPPFSYAWSDPSIGNTPNATGLASGTYSVTVTAANGCEGIATSTITTSTSTAPTGLVITPPSACLGDTVSLMATGGTAGPGATLVYYEGSCGGTVISDPTTVVVSGSGNYYARYEDSCGVTACAMAGVSCFNYTVEVASLLGGSYNPTTNLMNDDLRTGSLLPFTEPYSAMGYQHIGGGNESTVAAVFSVTGPDAIVDWVFVELRSANDNTTPVATRSALIQADGDIVDMDGSSGVDFGGLGIAAGNYWIVIRHRSHLDVMSTTPVPVGLSTATYDFIAAGAYNNGQLTLSNGTKVLYDGDVNQDNTINSADRSAIWNARNQAGYVLEDVTLNGYCGADDRSKAWNNRNVTSQVP